MNQPSARRDFYFREDCSWMLQKVALKAEGKGHVSISTCGILPTQKPAGTQDANWTKVLRLSSFSCLWSSVQHLRLTLSQTLLYSYQRRSPRKSRSTDGDKIQSRKLQAMETIFLSVLCLLTAEHSFLAVPFHLVSEFQPIEWR